MIVPTVRLPTFRDDVLPYLLILFIIGSTSCSKGPDDRFQGYAEGEFVYIASPFGGQLINLAVHKGETVHAQTLLFSLDNTLEKAASDEAQRRSAQAQANVEDISKGKRRSEIESLEAQLKQAEAKLHLSEKNYARSLALAAENVTSQQARDEATSQRDEDQQHVNQLKADLETAKLGGREDQKTAADEEVAARKADLTQEEWKLSQKEQRAYQDGLIFDTLFSEGEWVPAGQPVISFLPPKNIKVRTFVPEKTLSSIHIGQKAKIIRDGESAPLEGTVRYISPQAEYTPPVIYSRDSRTKLVYQIEITFKNEDAKTLHPGQPVEVQF